MPFPKAFINYLDLLKLNTCSWRQMCLPSCWSELSLAQTGINLLYDKELHEDF